jgi:hypothetical protein
MQTETPATIVETTVGDHSNTLFASLELSKAKWLVTANSPGEEKFSQHIVAGGDGGSLLILLARLKAKAEQRRGIAVKVVVIQEAGLEAFGFIACLSKTGSRATSSRRPRLRLPGAIGAPRRMRSTA